MPIPLHKKPPEGWKFYRHVIVREPILNYRGRSLHTVQIDTDRGAVILNRERPSSGEFVLGRDGKASLPAAEMIAEAYGFRKKAVGDKIFWVHEEHP